MYEYIVVDSGIIIKGHGRNFLNIAKKVVTVQEVIKEIRDPKARAFLESLPYSIEIRTPSDASLKFVADFAKKTGDFAALSLTDLKLIALSHSLEVSINGGKNLKSELKGSIRQIPPPSKPQMSWKKDIDVCSTNVDMNESVDGNTPESDDASETNEILVDTDDTVAKSLDSSINHFLNNPEPLSNSPVFDDNLDSSIVDVNEISMEDVAPVCIPTEESTEDNILAAVAESNTHCDDDICNHFESEENLNEHSGVGSFEVKDSRKTSKISSSGKSAAASTRSLAQEDDGKGWINTSNLASHKGKFGAQKKPSAVASEPPSVTCMTNDFAMQNVLMQIGLKICAADGQVIDSVKQFVLRCMACYTVHYDMSRLFCSRCGTDRLSKISASIDSDTGTLKLHLKKNYRVDTRGTVYPLPQAGSQGRYDGEILLREDQLLSGVWKQKCVQVRKNISSAFGEDITSDVGLHINKGHKIVVGIGSKDPNAMKGRERRGKKRS